MEEPALTADHGELSKMSMDQLCATFSEMRLKIDELENKLADRGSAMEALQAENNDLKVAQAKAATLQPEDAVDAVEAEEPDVDVLASDAPSVDAGRKKLDRMCKRRANGSLAVPQHVHDEWAKGGAARADLRKLLMDCGLDKALGFFKHDHDTPHWKETSRGPIAASPLCQEKFLKSIELEKTKQKEVEMKMDGDFFSEKEMVEKKIPANLC